MPINSLDEQADYSGTRVIAVDVFEIEILCLLMGMHAADSFYAK